MKLLSVAVPCYNSQAYMRNCVDSLLEGGDLVEILIVDDGSKDDTAKIADEYAAKYPNIVKAIHRYDRLALDLLYQRAHRIRVDRLDLVLFS